MVTVGTGGAGAGAPKSRPRMSAFAEQRYQIHNSELSYMESLALMAHYKCSSPLWVYIYNIHTGPFYSNKGTGLMRIYRFMYVSWFLYTMVAQNMLRTHDVK